MTKIKTKEKVYQIGKLKDGITLIQERRKINFTKLLGIITNGIKEVDIKILCLRTLQQKEENLSLLLITTMHIGMRRATLF